MLNCLLKALVPWISSLWLPLRYLSCVHVARPFVLYLVSMRRTPTHLDLSQFLVFSLTELQLWQPWGRFEPLSHFLSYCLPILQSHVLTQHSILCCLWRIRPSVEKWLSLHAAYVDVLLMPKSSISLKCQ